MTASSCSSVWAVHALLLSALAFFPPCDATEVRFQCVGPDQAPIDRSQKIVKVGHRNWLSQQLVSTLAEIVLHDFLGYTVEHVALRGSASAWAEDFSNEAIDVDLEQWQASPNSAHYKQVVVEQELVLDAGEIGYTGRSGLFTFRSALQSHELADYFKFYQNFSAAEAGFLTFGQSRLRATIGESFPVCDVQVYAWCGQETFEGYWAPPVCHEAPDTCIEIAASSPERDSGYLEQLVRNTQVRGIFAYYGLDDLPTYVSNVSQQQQSVMIFTWHEPDWLLLEVDAVRISFPDFQQASCSIESPSGDPDTGSIHCDYPETPLTKLVSRRVSDMAPEAFYFLTKLEIMPSQMSALLRATQGDSASSRLFEASCAFIRLNLDLIWRWMPHCSSSAEILRGGIQAISMSASDCPTSTILPEELPFSCANTIGVHTLPRNQTIRLVRRSWLTHDLLSLLAETLLRDHLGYNVIAVRNDISHTYNWGPEIAEGLYDVDMEQWQVINGSQSYRDYIKSGLVLSPGRSGFLGRAGVYVTAEALARQPIADYFKFFRNASQASDAGFIQHSSSRLAESSRINCSPLKVSWCGSGSLEGYWVPPACQQTPGKCLELMHINPLFDSGYLEQMVQQNQLSVVVAYFGSSSLQDNVRASERTFFSSPFYWWEPDIFTLQVQAVRVSFPDHYQGCDAANERDPHSGSIACDFSEVWPVKIAAARVLAQMPEAYYTLQRVELLQSDLADMFAKQLHAGGNSTASDLVCSWLARSPNLLRDWVPQCRQARSVDDLQANRTFFNAEALVCQTAPVCQANSVMRVGDAVTCEACPVGRVPDSLRHSCVVCEEGTEPSEDGDTCLGCTPGKAKINSSSLFCFPCAPGKFSAEFGQSSCDYCDGSSFQDQEGGVSCKLCDGIIWGSTNSIQGATLASQCRCQSGWYLPLQATACEPCPEGFYCKDGAAAADMPVGTVLTGEGTYPQVLKGYMTRSSDPFTAYMCSREESCPGGPPASCSSLRNPDAIACGECVGDAYEYMGECFRCAGGDWVPLVMLITCALVAAGVQVVAVNRNILMKSSAVLLWMVLLGLVLTTLQMLVLIRQIRAQWFEPLASALDTLSFLNFHLDLVRVGCILGPDRIRGFALRQLFAPVAVPLIGLLLLIKKRFFVHSCIVKTEFINTVGTFMSVFFIALVSSSVSPFFCYQHPADNGRSVAGDPSVLCSFTGDHLAMVSIGLVAMFLVPVPYLALIATGIWRYPSQIKHQSKSGAYLAAYRFLFVRFHPFAYWFGLVIAARSFLICIVSAVLSEPATQVVAMCIVLSAYAFAQQQVAPWRAHCAGCVDAIMTFGCTFMLLCLAVLTPFALNTQAVRVAATVAAVCSLLLPPVMAVWFQQRLALSQHFHIFICHHKAAAGGQARLLKMHLTAKTGKSIFIDSDNLVELDGLFDIVRSKVKNLLVYLTRDTLTRAWCVGEVSTAFKCHAYVTTVKTASWEQPSEELLELMPTMVDQSSCNLQEQGIPYEVMVSALLRVVSKDTPTIPVNVLLPGAAKFLDVATQAAAQIAAAKKASGSRQIWRTTSGTSSPPITPTSSRINAALPVSAASPRGTGTTSPWKDTPKPKARLSLDLGGLLAVADETDDEAVAAAAILIKKVNEQVLSFVGSGFLNVTDFEEPCLLDVLSAVETSRAVVVILSRRSLENYAQVTTMVFGMISSCTLIPVNLWDFNFPRSAYYSNQLPALWPGGIPISLQEAQMQLKAFFKLICVFFGTLASDQVLNTQAWDIMGRIPKNFDKSKVKPLGPAVIAVTFGLDGRASEGDLSTRDATSHSGADAGVAYGQAKGSSKMSFAFAASSEGSGDDNSGTPERTSMAVIEHDSEDVEAKAETADGTVSESAVSARITKTSLGFLSEQVPVQREESGIGTGGCGVSFSVDYIHDEDGTRCWVLDFPA